MLVLFLFSLILFVSCAADFSFFGPKPYKPSLPALINPFPSEGESADPISFSWEIAGDRNQELYSYDLLLSSDGKTFDTVASGLTSADFLISAAIREKFISSAENFWRVEIKDQNGKMRRGPVWSFIYTQEDIPENGSLKPLLIEPLNDSLNISQSGTTLKWSFDTIQGKTFTYTVFFGTLENSLNELIKNTQLMQVFTGTVEGGKDYFWQVKAKDTSGNEYLSDKFSFSTEGQSTQNNILKLLKPAEGEGGQSILPKFEWEYSGSSPVSYYKLHISLSEGADSLFKDGILTNSYKLTEPLDFSKIYYWKITAVLTNGETKESVVNSFITEGEGFNQAPNQPLYLSPTYKESDVSLNAVLKWDCYEPDGDGLYYRIYFGRTANPPVAAENFEGKEFSVSGPLEKGTKYYWKITAFDEHGLFSSGDVWEFETEEE